MSLRPTCFKKQITGFLLLSWTIGFLRKEKDTTFENFLIWISKNRCKNSHPLWLWTVTNAYVGLKKARNSVSFFIPPGDRVLRVNLSNILQNVSHPSCFLLTLLISSEMKMTRSYSWEPLDSVIKRIYS